VHVNGTLSKAAGSFKIDHPLDPANKFLQHSFVESPDMMNVYKGTIVLDKNGQAWVKLPDYFEALNRDYDYQLTAIGSPAPRLYIASEISNNRFQIAGGRAGQKISWLVTGVRQDAYAKAHPIQVEVDKTEEERGYYLNPALYGASPDKDITWKSANTAAYAENDLAIPKLEQELSFESIEYGLPDLGANVEQTEKTSEETFPLPTFEQDAPTSTAAEGVEIP
jgi:hypothetical protein